VGNYNGLECIKYFLLKPINKEVRKSKFNFQEGLMKNFYICFFTAILMYSPIGFSASLFCNFHPSEKYIGSRPESLTVPLNDLDKKDYEIEVFKNKRVDEYGITRISKILFRVDYSGILRKKFSKTIVNLSIIEQYNSVPYGMSGERENSTDWITQVSLDQGNPIEFSISGTLVKCLYNRN
jgi:hypothetical protein